MFLIRAVLISNAGKQFWSQHGCLRNCRSFSFRIFLPKGNSMCSVLIVSFVVDFLRHNFNRKCKCLVCIIDIEGSNQQTFHCLFCLWKNPQNLLLNNHSLREIISQVPKRSTVRWSRELRNYCGLWLTSICKYDLLYLTYLNFVFKLIWTAK